MHGIQGEAVVTLDGVEQFFSEGGIVHIPAQTKHRVSNQGEKTLIFIEVQRGSYFGEDDIERFEDDYGRVKVD